MILKKTYLKGLAWFVGSLVLSCANDALTKWLTTDGAIHNSQVTYCRLFFSAFFLILYALRQPHQLHTEHWGMHGIRGALLASALALWSAGLTEDTLTTATIVSFSIPLFTLVFSFLFLKEQVSLSLALLTLIGFIGVLVLFDPQKALEGDPFPLFLLFAVILFAILDVINKRQVAQEALFSMIFYSTVVALFLIAPWAYYHWTPLNRLSHCQILFLTLLGLGGNGIICCLLQAYRYTSLVSLAPVRYLELLFSISVSLIVFGERPSELWGACLIIPAVLAIIYLQHHNKEASPPQTPIKPATPSSCVSISS